MNSTKLVRTQPELVNGYFFFFCNFQMNWRMHFQSEEQIILCWYSWLETRFLFPTKFLVEADKKEKQNKEEIQRGSPKTLALLIRPATE